MKNHLTHFKCLLISTLILFNSLAYAGGHLHKEKDYQNAWCAEYSGITEYVLDDGARVDCLTCEYAIEFDFAEKWAEAIGQALYYATKTGKKPGVVLIMEDPEKEKRYLLRLHAVCDRYNIRIWTITKTNGVNGGK